MHMHDYSSSYSSNIGAERNCDNNVGERHSSGTQQRNGNSSNTHLPANGRAAAEVVALLQQRRWRVARSRSDSSSSTGCAGTVEPVSVAVAAAAAIAAAAAAPKQCSACTSADGATIMML